MIYQIRNREWYGEDFGGSVSFIATDAISQLALLRKAMEEVNIQILTFTANMEKFNAQVATFTGLANIIKALERISAEQAKATTTTEAHTKAGLDADAVIQQRIKTLLNTTETYNRHNQKVREAVIGLDEYNNKVTVTVGKEGQLAAIKQQTITQTQAQIRANQKLSDQIQRASVARASFNDKINRGLLTITKQTEKLNTVTGKTQQVIQAVNAQGQKYNATITSAGGKTVGFASSMETLAKQTDRSRAAVGQLTLSWQTFARVAVVSLIHRAVGLLSRNIRQAAQDAAQLSIKIAEVRTISQENQLATTEWTRGLRELSDAFGIGILDQTEAAYQTLSNQVAKGAEAFRFLEEANRLALVGVSDSAAATQFLSAVQNAFNLTLDDTRQIAAQTFKTIELGRVRLEEMANSIGQSAVPAANLGLRFSELAAAITTITIRGVPFEKAQTGIRNILLKLIRPTAEMSRLFRQWGVDSGEAAIAAFGFGGVLQKIEEQTKGSSTELGKIFGRIRAISGAMVFAGRGLETYQQNWAALQDAEESYAESVKETLENTGRTLQIEVNKIKNFFTVDIGGDLIESVRFVNENILSLSDAVKALSTTALVPLSVAAVLATKSLGGLLIAHPIAAAMVVMGLAIKTVLDNLREDSERTLKEIEDSYDKALDRFDNQAKRQVDITFRALQEEVSLTKQVIASIQGELNKVEDEQIKLDKEIGRNIREAYKDVAKELNAGIKEIGKSIRESEKIIENATKKILDIRNEFEQIRFGFELDDAATLEERVAIQKRRVDELRADATKLLALGTDAGAKRAEAALKDATKIAIDIRSNQKKGEEDAIKNQEKILDLEKERAKINQDIERIRRKGADDDAKARRRIIDEARKSGRSSIRTTSGGDFDITTTNKKALEQQKDLLRKQDERQVKLDRQLQKEVDITEQIKELNIEFKKQVDVGTELRDLEIERAKIQATRIKQAKEDLATKEKAAKEQQREIDLLKQSFQEVSEISVKDILGIEDIEEQRKSIQEALTKVEEFRQKIAGSGALGLANQIKIEETIVRRKEQLETILQKNLNQQRLDDAKKSVEIQAKALVDEKKARLDAIEEFNRRAAGATQTVVAEFERFFLQTTDAEKLLGTKIGEQQKKLLSAFIAGPSAEKLDALIKSIGSITRGRTVLGQGARQAEINILIPKFEVLAKQLIEAESARLNEIQRLKEEEAKNREQLKNTQNDLANLLPKQDKTNELLAQSNLNFRLMITGLEDIRKAVLSLRNTENRASGGAVGTDIVPAMLSPGEFVMNARASKQFYSQLVAMNAGTSNFARGGSTTNVGDINVSMQSSGNESVDVVKFGKLLRREIRRGTLRLN